MWLLRQGALSSFIWTICISSPIRLGTSNHQLGPLFISPIVSGRHYRLRMDTLLYSRHIACKTESSHRKLRLPIEFNLAGASASFSCQPLSSFRGLLEKLTILQMSTSSTPDVAVQEEVDPGDIEGTNLRVLKYPHPLLRAPDEEITVFDDNLKQIAKEMFLVMYACKGVGLAAPQVGINKRLMVFNPEGDAKKWPKEVVMVNPRIVEVSPSTDVEEEGCLSFPNMKGSVKRHKWIKVEAFDLKGKKIKKKFEGWEARVFQHEYDHLDGRFYVDRLEPEERAAVQPVLDGLIKAHTELYPELPPAL